MKPMKPEDFARILCEKLEKVIRDRESAEKAMRETTAPVSVSIFIKDVMTRIVWMARPNGIIINNGHMTSTLD